MDVKSLIKEKALMIEPVLAEYVPSDNDKVSEMLSHTVTAGGNIFDGEEIASDFGQFQKNDNVYLKMTYCF